MSLSMSFTDCLLKRLQCTKHRRTLRVKGGTPIILSVTERTDAGWLPLAFLGSSLIDSPGFPLSPHACELFVCVCTESGVVHYTLSSAKIRLFLCSIQKKPSEARLCLKSHETEMWSQIGLGFVQSPTIYGKESCDGKAL